MNTTTNTRGVSETMVEREVVLSVLRNLKCPHDGKNGDVYEKAAAHVWGDAIITAMKAVQSLAALSAPEPAAQAVGEIIRPAKSRNAPVGASVRWFDREPPVGTKLYTAPLAQPAERVPDGWKLAMWVLQSDLYRKLPEEERAVCDALVAENPYIAASPAPSEGGKGVDRG